MKCGSDRRLILRDSRSVNVWLSRGHRVVVARIRLRQIEVCVFVLAH